MAVSTFVSIILMIFWGIVAVIAWSESTNNDEAVGPAFFSTFLCLVFMFTSFVALMSEVSKDDKCIKVYNDPIVIDGIKYINEEDFVVYCPAEDTK